MKTCRLRQKVKRVLPFGGILFFAEGGAGAKNFGYRAGARITARGREYNTL